MTEDSAHLRRIIFRAVADARAAGLDYETQSQLAAKMVMQMRPHLSEREAVQIVRRIREHEA